MLQTYYKSNASLFGENNNYSISGAIPGMITTGDMSVNLASAGNSTSSVSGGITFRNTPDQVSVDYNPISNERITNWRMLVNYYDANGTQKENLYEGSYDTKNQWQTANLKLLYSATERLVGINKFPLMPTFRRIVRIIAHALDCLRFANPKLCIVHL